MLVLFAPALVSAQPADTIYHNGKVITMWDKKPAAEALAVRGNRLLAVGSNAEVLRTAGPATKKVDLHGRTVVPGLIENHTHPVTAALSEQDAPVPAMHSIADIQAYIRARAASLPANRVIFVPKVYPSRLKERRYPNRYDIDTAAPGRLAMCDNGYAGVLNSALLKEAGITRDTPQPPNGKIIKDDRGEPTGLIRGTPQLLARFRQSRPRT
jgi:predicted amidohydrolase YtcJ